MREEIADALARKTINGNQARNELSERSGSDGHSITDGAGNGWQVKVESGSERRIAGRLVRAVRARLGLDGRDGFGRRIDYPPFEVA